MQQRIISFLAVNEVGVLNRIFSLLSKRGFNVESITAGTTDNKKISRINIMMFADDKLIEQMIKQLSKLLDVVAITELEVADCTSRELALIKISTVGVDTEALCDSVVAKKGVIVSMGEDYITAQFTGSYEGINTCIESMKTNKIIEIARTGMVALSSQSKQLK